MATTATAAPPTLVPLHRQVTWWALGFPAIMVVALVIHSFPLLNWIHVLAGALWTGADIFMGFMLGPVMRRLTPEQRTGVISFLVPRTLLYFPMASLTTTTAGWYLSAWLGWISPGNAQFPWIVASLVLVSLMTVQGLGIFLPNSLRIWFEMRKPEPDREKMIRLNQWNIRLAGMQGLMQVAIIVVMSHFAVGG